MMCGTHAAFRLSSGETIHLDILSLGKNELCSMSMRPRGQ